VFVEGVGDWVGGKGGEERDVVVSVVGTMT